jgi:protocatechuate 3,4-dioxygenase beta subunit
MRLHFIAVLMACAAAAQPTGSKASLEGKVADLSGHALARVKLTLAREGTPPISLFNGSSRGPVTQSNADGKFSFDPVEPGRYFLLAEKTGFVRQAYGDRPAPNRGDLPMDGAVLDLTAGSETMHIAFRMTPTATITGRVFDENGDPIRNAVVKTSMVGRDQEIGFARTDPRGEYRIAEHPPGDYYLFVSYIPRAGAVPTGTTEEFVTTYYPHATERAKATPIRIDAGASLASLDLTTEKKTVVRVNVRGRITGTVTPTQVILTNTDSSDIIDGSARIKPASDGSFEFKGIEAGHHNIVVGVGPSDVNGRTAVDVGFRDVGSVEVVARPEFQLPGRVIIDDAAEPAGLRVIAQVDLSDGWPRAATTDSKGGFILNNLVNGVYRIRVSSLPPGTYQAGSAEIDLTGGAPGEPVTITLKRSAGEITGTVEGVGGLRAIVTLVPEPAQPEALYLYRRVATDQKGRFAIKDLVPGAYRIYAWNELEPSAELAADFLEKHAEVGSSVTVQDNSHQLITLRPIQ